MPKKIYTNAFYNLNITPAQNAKYVNPYPYHIKVMAKHAKNLYVINVKRGCFWRTGCLMDGTSIRKLYQKV